MKSEKYLSMAKDIRSKVEDLLDEYNTFEPSISKMFLDGQPLYEQAIKFTHLVYSFDPNLPLNRELVDLPNKCKGCIIKTFPQENDVFKNFLYLLKCFTDYLETFHD